VYDYCNIDSKEAVTFLVGVKELLKDSIWLMLGVLAVVRRRTEGSLAFYSYTLSK